MLKGTKAGRVLQVTAVLLNTVTDALTQQLTLLELVAPEPVNTQLHFRF
jgi:hypothetical protein